METLKTAIRQRLSTFQSLRSRDFALVWSGLAISGVGDQFYIIALPWLVLRLTGDPLAVGTVMAVGAIPSAAFMLFGGAIADRLTPVRVLLWSNTLRLLMLCLLAVLVFGHLTYLWSLYLIVLVMGLANGLFLPARFAVVPYLVPPESLQPANGLLMGTGHACMAIGPALAGLLIAALAGHEVAGQVAEEAPDTFGIGVAFCANAAALVVFALCLWPINPIPSPTETDQPEGIWSATRTGLGSIWQDRSVRMVMLVGATFNFLIAGPLGVGLPVLADARLEGGAAAYGFVMSALAAGMIVGSVAAGVTRAPRQAYFGPMLIVVMAIAGVCTILLGFVHTTRAGMVCTGVMGLGFGYIDVVIFTWLQRRVPEELVGRMMGLVMFVIVGVHPLSNAVSGLVLSIDTVALFAGAGGVLCAAMAIYAMIPAVRSLGVPASDAHPPGDATGPP